MDNFEILHEIDTHIEYLLNFRSSSFGKIGISDF